jgi:hypothetical protein
MPATTDLLPSARLPIAHRNGTTSPLNEEAERDRTRTYLAAILLLAVALRVYSMIAFPFDQDELYTVVAARDLFHAKVDFPHARPIYFLLQHPLLSLLPQTPAMLRLLPTLFGVLGVWMTWRLGRALIGARAGLVAALLVAISPWHLYSSSTARYYTLVYLLACVALVWLPAAYATDSKRHYLVTLATLMVGTLTHPSFVVAMVGPVIGLTLVRPDYSLGWRWPSRRGWMYLWLPYAAFIVAVVTILTLIGRGSTMTNADSRGVLATLRLVPAMIDWMTVTVFVAGLGGAVMLAAAARPERRVGMMALAATVFSFAALYVASFSTGVYADYGIGILPLVFICVGALVQSLTDIVPRSRRTAAEVLALSVLLAGILPSFASQMSDGGRFDYRPAYRRIEQVAPNVPVLSWPEDLRLQYVPRTLVSYPLPDDRSRLDGILAKEKDLWVVVSVKRYGIVIDDQAVFAHWLGDHCRLTDRFERPRFDERVYRVELYRCTAPAAQVAATRRVEVAP